MLRAVMSFLILAIIAGALGFYGVEGISLDIARILFLIFLVLFGCSLLAQLVGDKHFKRF